MGDSKTINKASHETWTHADRVHRWTAMAAKSIAVTKIITVKASFTVQQAFETLSDENVLSAPIFDENAHKYVGVIDIVDIGKKHWVSSFTILFSNALSVLPRTKF
eukprot:TRINITY_DN325_c0_g1_i7.p1 TRINITY_DN325_c0_g1~~TRINITY_DN325_c0_g1_i7.p1  ORF type:complete len:106 (+),score=10.80 TRINITY_DN325_c0_g1_i7:98-415(+)